MLTFILLLSSTKIDSGVNLAQLKSLDYNVLITFRFNNNNKSAGAQPATVSHRLQ